MAATTKTIRNDETGAVYTVSGPAGNLLGPVRFETRRCGPSSGSRASSGVKTAAPVRARSGEGDLPPVAAPSYRADLVPAIEGADEPMAVIIEVQPPRKEQKRWVWMVSVAATHARLRGPAHLVIVAPSTTVAA